MDYYHPYWDFSTAVVFSAADLAPLLRDVLRLAGASPSPDSEDILCNTAAYHIKYVATPNVRKLMELGSKQTLHAGPGLFERLFNDTNIENITL